MGFHADLMAEVSGVSREEQDRWALGSHAKAAAARAAGLLRDEIVAVPSAVSAEPVDADELIREGTPGPRAVESSRANLDRSVRKDTYVIAVI